MADAEMAASLLGQIQHDLRTRHRVARSDHSMLMGFSNAASPRKACRRRITAYLCITGSIDYDD